ncbi:MAG: hypothetical protein BWY50_02045 [Spirochaetes bacterium ADurb.Bin315]|nr:MAG: hypothetical protein BWY50_02045 [Spirochaetes bacterium ADurb.Bin315]
MNPIGNDLALHVLLDEDRPDGSRIPVVKTAHRIEEMGGVQNSHLHPLEDVLIAGVGVSGKKNDAPLPGQEGQFTHSFELGGYRHADDVAFAGIDDLIENRQIHRKDPFRILGADPLHRDEGTFHVDAEDLGPLLLTHRVADRFDRADHLIKGVGIDRRHERRYSDVRQAFTHLKDRVGIAVFRSEAADSVEVAVDHTGGDVSSGRIENRGIRGKVLVVEAGHVEDVSDLPVFVYIDSTILQFSISRYNGTVYQYGSLAHGMILFP